MLHSHVGRHIPMSQTTTPTMISVERHGVHHRRNMKLIWQLVVLSTDQTNYECNRKNNRN